MNQLDRSYMVHAGHCPRALSRAFSGQQLCQRPELGLLFRQPGHLSRAPEAPAERGRHRRSACRARVGWMKSAESFLVSFNQLAIVPEQGERKMWQAPFRYFSDKFRPPNTVEAIVAFI